MRILSILAGIVVLIALAAGTAVMLRQSDAPKGTSASPGATQPMEIAESEADPEEVLAVTHEAEGEDKFVAYYFHWSSRCQTCLEIEEYSSNVIHESFADDIEEGRLEWHALNMELPEYEHFQQDFELSTPSLVLLHVDHGQIADWTVLAEVWDLVYTPWDLEEFVKAQTREYLAIAYGPE